MKKRSFRPPLLPSRTQKSVETITPVKVLAAPRPDVPDEILQQELDVQTNIADLWALFTIHEDGSSDVMLLTSTGSNVLDSYGMDAAKRWRFRAAKKEGQPVTSYLRLHIEFRLE